MSITRIRDDNPIRPLHVVMVFLVTSTVAGGSWFLSAAESPTPVDGAIAWQVESPLRAVVQLLCLNYEFPTIHAGAVKIYLLGIGTGLALIALGVTVIGNRGTPDSGYATDESPPAPPRPANSEAAPATSKSHIAPLRAAQILVGMYLLWSFASSRWSAAPELAIGGSILLTIHFLWAFALSAGLSRPAARVAANLIIAVTAVTAGIAIWYYYGRNPTLRAKFPFGNPNFLSACLIPGVLLGGTFTYEKIRYAVRTGGFKSIALAAGAMIGVTAMLWAFHLAESRGPQIGLAIGLLAVLFFAWPGRAKLVPVILIVGLTIGAWLYYSSIKDESLPRGRSATIRCRLYTWGYAWQMFNEKPLTGHGQGGFVLSGDSRAVNDVMDDPLVFQSRIAHAHNEWLEVMADLGAVGIVLVATALALTLHAGMVTLNVPLRPAERWALLGLMGALVGLVVEEAFGVGLRVSGVPTLFYTVIGLIWAMSGRSSNLLRRLSSTSGRQFGFGTGGIILGLAALVISQQDFDAARNAYRIRESIENEEYETAIELAQGARIRLNPQRALTNLYRLSEAHMLVARKLQERAREREARALEAELSTGHLAALAQLDRKESDRQCVEGNLALKELVERSPGYLNHGRVEYWLNLIQADNAAARDDPESQELALRYAAKAIERELLRQPFSPSVALDYVRVAGPGLEPERTIEVLARPLRYNRITPAYVEVLTELMNDPHFMGRFDAVIQQVRWSLSTSESAARANATEEPWAPEKLRIAATIHFLEQEYRKAADDAVRAAGVYETLFPPAPMAAASCHAELADCQFFAGPGNPGQAIANAEQALALAPDSLMGRRLSKTVRDRMIEYHLAAGEENQARRLLEDNAHLIKEGETLPTELAKRYRMLCELLLRELMVDAGDASAIELTTRLQHWAQRAVALDPDDAPGYLLAAELAFRRNDGEGTAAYLRGALDRGLAPGLAAQFVAFARRERPGDPSLEELWRTLVGPPPGEHANEPPPLPPPGKVEDDHP